MSTTVEIQVSELFAGDQRYTIATNGVGSCIVIVLYDRQNHIGGMAHAILPRAKEGEISAISGGEGEKKSPVKYAGQAIDILIKEIESIGGRRENIVAKLIGGAHMFALLEGETYGVGWENIHAARNHLSALGIPIETEIVGGAVGRNVRFDCATGIVEVITKV